MKNICKYILPAALALPGYAAATVFDFETTDGIRSIEMYDVWEASPLRTGAITGNCAITDNPFADLENLSTGLPANTSGKVLGAQRSRFGSNRYGVRINFTEDQYFPLNHTTQYVHVNIIKPKEGRVMLVGLGSRDDRPDQDKYVEQFWQLSSNTIEPNAWYDAVFPIHGADGITLRALVVIPDCESPHNLTDDFLFYIDNIEVNNNATPRIVNEFYAISGDKKSTNITHASRYTSGFSVKVGDGEAESVDINQQTTKRLYHDMTDNVFYAKAGQTVQPKFSYSGNAMHGYCFVDWDNNGRFEASVDDNNAPQGELVTFSKYDGKNVNGESVNGNNTTMPAFTIPADTKPGMYRMRMKIDWNSIDPLGCAEADNSITNNGGVIIDAMLCVHGDVVYANDFQLNGEVLSADGQKLNRFEVPFGESHSFKMAPEKGFNYGNCSVKTGFNINAETPYDKYGNRQYVQHEVKRSAMDEEGCFTIPGEWLRGAEVLFEGEMISDDSFDINDFFYPVSFPRELKLTRNDRIIESVGLTYKKSDKTVSCSDNTEKYVYVDHTDNIIEVGTATVTPKIGYKGNYMHSYIYFDLNCNGDFELEDEMLAYSNVDGKNHKGGASSQSPNDWRDSFSLSNVTPGIYRTRFKVDWDDPNPAGRYTGTNDIDANGGGVVDILTHIHAVMTPMVANIDTVVGALQVAGSETTISETAANANHGEALTIASETTLGAPVLSLHAVYGYNTAGPKTDKFGIKQWDEADITPQVDGTYVIPADIMKYPVTLTGTFGDPKDVGVTEITAPGADTIHNLQGVRISNPAHGLYIVNGKTQRI